MITSILVVLGLEENFLPDFFEPAHRDLVVCFHLLRRLSTLFSDLKCDYMSLLLEVKFEISHLEYIAI